MKSFFSRQNPQRLVSSLLVIWLSGFVLLFCCGAMEVKAKTVFCPLAEAKSHCDKSEKSEKSKEAKKAETDDSAVYLNKSENEKFDCCGFLPAIFDKARKVEKNQQPAIIASTAKIQTPKFTFVSQSFKSPTVYQPIIRDRGGAYLKNRVFRI